MVGVVEGVTIRFVHKWCFLMRYTIFVEYKMAFMLLLLFLLLLLLLQLLFLLLFSLSRNAVTSSYAQ